MDLILSIVPFLSYGKLRAMYDSCGGKHIHLEVTTDEELASHVVYLINLLDKKYEYEQGEGLGSSLMRVTAVSCNFDGQTPPQIKV